ncbi:MAG: hypothetical protein WCR48_05960 [Bacteroidales bacterium]
MNMIISGIRKMVMLTAVLAIGQACIKEKADKVGDGYAIIETDLETYSGADDGNALGAAEYVIKSARLYAFDGDVLDNMVYVDNISSSNLGAVTVSLKVKQASSKTLYVVLNEPSSLSGVLSVINKPSAFEKRKRLREAVGLI